MVQSVAEKKSAYAEKVTALLERYDQAFLVHADNVGSLQIQKIRIALRAHNSTLLFGKNTLMKKCVRNYLKNTGDKKWECVPEMLVGNVGLLFIEGDMSSITDLVKEYNMPAPARVGATAPCDVVVLAGPTGMDPSQTSFFQALNVTTKITKGSVEITADVKVLTAGQKVGGSEAVLLQKMGMKPFEYGLVVLEVIENGTHYSAKVLELSDDDLQATFNAGLANVTALAMETKYPAVSTVPHHIINATKDLLALVCELETYSFPLADKVKDTLAKIASGEFVCAAPAAAAGGGKAAAAAAPEPEPEEEEEDMGFDLFD